MKLGPEWRRLRSQHKGEDITAADARWLALLTALGAAYYWLYRRNIANASTKKVIGESLFVGTFAGLLALSLEAMLKSVLVITDRSAVITDRSADIQEQIAISNQAVQAVETAIGEMDVSTTRLQKFAIWIGVCTGIVGAVVGGFAGAFAAQLFGS